ncbi:helix-turn-helix transcriptional regulator [Luteimonas sp. SMYT11W]|uniref:Helix-turn-helix transcriptional regulator n=1 Tax=Luteimonas flava TaxID=3115822 RepID=A0ABU7WE04_9GAMM
MEIAHGRLDIAQAVKQMRKISGLTQEEFAKHRDMSLVTLKRIESGKGNPTVGTLDSIGRLFGLRVTFGHSDPDIAAQWLDSELEVAVAEPATRKRLRSKKT